MGNKGLRILQGGAAVAAAFQAFADAKEAIRNSTESFVNSANDNLMSVQNQYDEETDHGRNSSKQDEWGNKDEYK